MNEAGPRPVRCPRCNRPYNNDARRISADHILPKERGGKLVMFGDVRNSAPMCQECNGWRAACGHCWGLAACIAAVVAETGLSRAKVYQKWQTGRVVQGVALRTRTDHTRRMENGVQLGRAVIRAGGADEFIWPADTAAKRVWNLATLAKARYRGPVPVDLR